MGWRAGFTGQNRDTVAIGSFSATDNQSFGGIAIGSVSGQSNQGEYGISIGYGSGNKTQGENSIAIGHDSGYSNQGKYSIAIGSFAGLQDQSDNSIILNATGSPLNAGASGFYVAPIRDISSNLVLVYNTTTNEITYTASSNITGGIVSPFSSSLDSISVGRDAGQQLQGSDSIAIGTFAGYSNQLLGSIAIGSMSGNENQGVNAIAIGDNAGWSSQNDNTIAIGTDSGHMNQGQYAIAIGTESGSLDQGQYSIAIGYQSGLNDQHSNSIIINATGSELDTDVSGLFIAPIRGGITGPHVLYYEPQTKEITYSSPKSFIIDHPLNPEKYLVHACLEGPEAGVYYRGIGEILPNQKFTIIHLPHYVQSFSTNFTIQITRIIDDDRDEDFSNLKTSLVKNNSFKVFGTPGKFFWHVYGQRGLFPIEPLKKEVNVKGDGPYKWI